MSLSLWPGTSRSFEEEHFRDRHQPGKQFHRRWGSEGLLCPGIPSGCSWCLCRQLFERLCSLLMLILRISRFSNLADCQWSGWIAFWLELILCGMMWYAWYAFYWDICMILAGSASLRQRHLPWTQWELFFLETQSRKLRVVSPLYFMRSRRCQIWSTSMSLSLWPGTSRSFEEEHFRDRHQPGKQFHRRWGSEGLLCPGMPSGCSWCLCRQLFERLCSLLMLILRISRFSNLVDCQWSGWIAFWLELILCGMMWYAWYAFYWDICMILAGSASLRQRHLPWTQWELFFLETQSRKLRVVSHLYFVRSHRC